MSGIAQPHNIPLPRGWPRRVRSAVIQVISLARVARRTTPFRGRSCLACPRLVSLVHYSEPYSNVALSRFSLSMGMRSASGRFLFSAGKNADPSPTTTKLALFGS